MIEAARSLAGLSHANSREFDPDGSECVIDLMDEQRNISAKGGTMRLGSYPCAVKKGTLLHEIYGRELVQERHRHRYEVSPAFRDRIAESGKEFWGYSDLTTVLNAIYAKTMLVSLTSSAPLTSSTF